MTIVLAVGGISTAHAAARSRGADLIHVRTHPGHSMLPASEYADTIDLTDPACTADAQLETVMSRLPTPGPDAILCLHDDSVVLGAKLAQRLQLPFASVDSAEATVDKARMRHILDGSEWGTVAHATVVDGCVVWRTPRPTGGVVLKPGHGRASIGVHILPNADVASAVVGVNPEAFDGYVVEEQKIGTEYSVESVLLSVGEWHGITEKQTRDAIEIGHLHPAPLDSDAAAAVRDAAIGAVRMLGVENGLLHTEVILDAAGTAHIVETHLRGGGDGILDLVRHSTGLDLTQLYIDDMLRILQKIPRPDDLGFASSQYSLPESSGTVLGWDGLADAKGRTGVLDVGTVPAVGDSIGGVDRSSYSRLAWAIATGPDADIAQERARSAAATVRAVLKGDSQ